MSDAAKPAGPGMVENAKTTAIATKEKVTVAATEALGTAQQYGKDGAAAATKYANQAGDYIKKQTAPSPAAVEEKTEEKKEAAVEEKTEEKKEETATTEGGGGVGDYINKAKGLFK